MFLCCFPFVEFGFRLFYFIFFNLNTICCCCKKVSWSMFNLYCTVFFVVISFYLVFFQCVYFFFLVIIMKTKFSFYVYAGLMLVSVFFLSFFGIFLWKILIDIISQNDMENFFEWWKIVVIYWFFTTEESLDKKKTENIDKSNFVK